MQAPIQGSILELKLVELILAQTGFFMYPITASRYSLISYGDHLASVMCFLGAFAGHWPSRNDRSAFTYQYGHLPFSEDSVRAIYPYYLTQIHFRFFASMYPGESSRGIDGLLYQRQRCQIASSLLRVSPHLFEERRISIFGILSSNTSSSSIPAMYRVLILTEAGVIFPQDIFKNSELKWGTGLEGTIAFHGAILSAVKVWETEWNNALDQVDDCLRVQLGQTMSAPAMSALMFDDGFERSRLYFTILQILRIFGECIRTVSEDLRTLNGLFHTLPAGFPQNSLTPYEKLVLKSNWELVTIHQKEVEGMLLQRVFLKTEELKSLRDGVRCLGPWLIRSQLTRPIAFQCNLLT